MKLPVLAFLLGSLVMVGQAQPVSRLTVHTFHSEAFSLSVTQQPLPETLKPLKDFTFLITNKSPKAIVGMQVVWEITTQDGVTKKAFATCDDVLRRSPKPVVNSRSTIVIAPPNIFLPLEEIYSNFKTTLGQLDAADIKSATATIDSIVFADGEIIGPDTNNYEEDLQSKIKAAHWLAENLSNSTDPISDLGLIMYSHAGGFIETWKRRLALVLMGPAQHGSLSATLQNFQRIPDLNIHRAQ